jgi:hypothetical protein
MDLNDLYNFVDFWSKRGDQPGTAPQVTGLRDAMKDTGKIVDDYVLGGTYQANMRGQDALLRQLALNAVAGGVGAGLGYGASKVGTKLAPKVDALMQWIKPRDIGVHVSGFNDLPEILPNINTARGAGPIPGFPLVPNQTYKFSSRDYLNKKMTPDALISSAERYIPNIAPRNDVGTRNFYVTKSLLGKMDPETQILIDNIAKGNYSPWPVPRNGRITPKQEILSSLQVTTPDYVDWAERGMVNLPPNTPVLEYANKIPESVRNNLLQLIEKQQSLEKVKSLGRGAVVGGTAVGTALTPLAVARPALGFNNKK